MKTHILTVTVTLAVSTMAAAAATSISPQSARPGDTFKLVVTTDCVNGVAAHPLDKDSLTISGSDLTYTFVSANGCSAIYTVAVAAKPINREFAVAVGSGNTPLENFTFRITDISPNPIPPGIDPQADAWYNLMSERMCSDQFGARVARHYYCMIVTLGNNSAYPLMVASVGFLRRDGAAEYRDTAASYLSVRATVQQEHVFSARNLTLRGLQSAGVLIAGFVPFSGNAGRKGRIGIWSALTSTVSSVWDNLIPDRTVAQAGNLDDAALRDGRVIANNSQAKFAVFVERDVLMPILLKSQEELNKSADHAAQVSAELKAQGDATPEPARRAEMLQQSKKWREESQILREDATKRTAATTKTTKPMLDPLARRKAPLEDDLLAVRHALGSLIIVGDQIQFLQRVQVDASAVSPEVLPAPEVRSATPGAAPNQSVDIVLQGKWLTKATVTALQCNPQFETVPDASGTSLTLKGFTLKDCAESAIALVINSPGGSATFNLPVAQKPVFDTPKNDSATVDASGKTTITLSGKFLTGGKPKITLVNGTDSQPVATDTPPEVTGTGVTLTFTAPVAYRKAGTTANITLGTTVGDSNAVAIKLTLALKPALDPPAAAVTINKAQAVFALTGKSLKEAKPTVILKNAAGRSTTIQASDKDLAVSKASDTGLTITLSKIETTYIAADSTATITVKTDAGDSDPIVVKLQLPAKK